MTDTETQAALDRLRRSGRGWLAAVSAAEPIIAPLALRDSRLGALGEALRDARSGAGGTLGTPQEILDLVEKALGI